MVAMATRTSKHIVQLTFIKGFFGKFEIRLCFYLKFIMDENKLNNSMSKGLVN